MAPVFVVKLRRNSHPEEKDLHFNGGFDSSECFYGFISSSEEGPEIFALSAGHMNGAEAPVPELSADELRIDSLGFGVSFFTSAVDIGRVDHDGIVSRRRKGREHVLSEVNQMMICYNLSRMLTILGTKELKKKLRALFPVFFSTHSG